MKLTCWSRDVTFKLMRSMGISKVNRQHMKRLNIFLVRVGISVDRHLMCLLPRILATMVAMLLFAREEKQ